MVTKLLLVTLVISNTVSKVTVSVVLNVISNTTVFPLSQLTIAQDKSNASGEGSSVFVSDRINEIISIITDGVTAAPATRKTGTPPPQASQAIAQLKANKDFIIAETTAYINAKYGKYNQDKCLRDTNLIVDALAFDMLYPTTGDSQSTFAGLQYWNQAGYVGAIANELTTTTNAVNYVKALAQKIVTLDTSGTRYQSTVTQNISLPTAS